MARKLTEFTFYKDTPLVDLKNTILFNNNEERDKFFNEKYHTITSSVPFNFVRDRLTLRVGGDIEVFKDANYCSFVSDFDNIRYYCFIPEYSYINDNTIELNLMIDGIMTFCQGHKLMELDGVTVKRQHLSSGNYKYELENIKNNDDVIKTHTKRYFHKDMAQFKDLNILIHSSVSLSSSFGTEDNPRIQSATGGTVDGVASPVDLYLTDVYNFKNIMLELKPYPWITQNFKKIIMIPKDVLNKDMEGIDVKEVENEDADLKGVYKITGGNTSSYYDNPEFMKNLNKSYDELLKLYGIDKEDQHLLRNEYTTIELYNYSGQELIIDPGKLDIEQGLTFDTKIVGGYNNELATYVKGYKGKGSTDSFLNDSLIFQSFDEIPILIDNYSLAMARNAHQRAYTESNLLTNKVGRILNPNNDLQDRLVASVSVLSNLSPLSIGRGLVDEHEFYRQQQAQQKDMKLQGPTITEQTTNNSMNIANGFYGVTMLLSKPNNQEMNKIRAYYKLFGYEVEWTHSKIDHIQSMSICNYLELEGNYRLPNIERSIMETIKIRLENGVRFWHNNNTRNPFNQNILNNRRIL